MNVRCKFRVEEVARLNWTFTKKEGEPELRGERVKLVAQYDDGLSKENKSYADATPTGTLEFTVSNRAVHGQFQPGDCYYLDLTPAPK